MGEGTSNQGRGLGGGPLPKIAVHGRDAQRVCRYCECTFKLDHPAMRRGDPFLCECGAKGNLQFFPCPKPGCECGGFFSVHWTGEIVPASEMPNE